MSRSIPAPSALSLALSFFLCAGCGASSALELPDSAIAPPDASLDHDAGPPPVPLEARAIASEGGAACAIDGGGRVRCWGAFTGFVVSRVRSIGARPALVPGIERAVALAVSSDHACAVRDDGTVACWGFDSWGQTGAPREAPLEPYDFHDRAVEVAGIDDAIDVAVGWLHSCALRAGGTVACWGDGSLASLGDAGATEWSAAPVAVAGLDRVVRLEAGGSATCAVRDDGELLCWGECAYGACGPGGRAQTPRRVETGVAVRDVAVGTHREVILGTDGIVRAIGLRVPDRADGSGTLSHTEVAEVLAPAPGAIAIAGAGRVSCVLGDDGSVRCLGDDATGSLGRGAARAGFRDTLEPVIGIGDAIGIAAGLPVCALSRGGALSCWGGNAAGQLGIGIVGSKSPADALAVVGDAISVTSGLRDACALRADATIACWGDNERGQLGDGTDRHAPAPVSVVGIDDARAIDASYGLACAIRDRGEVWCWGAGDRGQLGDGPREDARAPVRVPGVVGAIAIETAHDRACAIDGAGRAICWGANDRGQAAGEPLAATIPPTAIAGLDRVRALALGGEHTCALEEGGTIACWGQDPYGAIGFVHDPFDVARLEGGPERRWLEGAPSRLDVAGASAIASSGRSLCIAAADAVGCRGAGDGGDLALAVPGASWVAVGSDGGYTVLCARGADGIACASELGGLDVAAFGAREAGPPRAVAVGFPICALGADGAVRCAGGNAAGELGDGEGFYTTPQRVIE